MEGCLGPCDAVAAAGWCNYQGAAGPVVDMAAVGWYDRPNHLPFLDWNQGRLRPCEGVTVAGRHVQFDRPPLLICDGLQHELGSGKWGSLLLVSFILSLSMFMCEWLVVYTGMSTCSLLPPDPSCLPHRTACDDRIILGGHIGIRQWPSSRSKCGMIPLL